MADRQKLLALRRQIAEYFANMYPKEEYIEIESKMNSDILDDEPVYKVKSQEELDEQIKKKKNYYGTRHLVPEKVEKKLLVVNVRLPKNEVMEILRKDRKHPLWEKEITYWTAKDWDSLFKLRDEK